MTSPFDFRGCLTALVTPFKKGALDISSFKALIKHQLDGGVQGFVIGGTTGESPNLKLEELKELVKIAQAEVGGRVPIVVGTGSNSTAKSVELTALAGSWGADAALIVVPYYNKPPQRGLLEHYRAIHSAGHLPLILYNVPGRTITSLTLETIVTLAREERIIGIKEATGDLKFADQILADTPEEFLLLSGDDATCLDLVQRGGDGVISVLSHVIPGPLRKLMDDAANQQKGFAAEFAKYKRLTDLLFVEANPIPVKMALHLMGVIASPELRLPLVRATEEISQQLQSELEKLGLVQV